MKFFYRINASRATWREHAFDTPWLLLPLVALIKLFRLRGGGSTDDPPVESIAPFEVEEAAVPAEVRERFGPLTQELAALGFGQPIYHQIYHPLCFTHIYWATFLHPTDRAVARIHHRVWSKGAIHKSYLYPVFISEMANETFVVSSAGRPDLLAPASVQIVYEPGASAAELWERHQRRLDDLLPSRSVTVDTPAHQRELIERHHGALRDFHLARGVFEPASEVEQEKLTAQCEGTQVKAPPPSVEEAVLARLERAPLEKPRWRNTLLILAISLLLFLAAGVRDAPGKILWILIGVLLFHELGHYLAMKWFGYRNVRMFFIPTLGAAVTGKHYNVSGWKKAVVALMGPIPGILIGAALGFAGIWWHRPLLIEIALLQVILNGLNLLPFLPLDGGWVLHAVLFCRHPLLDLAARVLALPVIFGLALLENRWIALIGILFLISLPASWRVARTAQRLRRKGVSALSPDALSIPPPTARAILAELGAGKHNRMPANVLAQQVVRVFETLNARPPGVLASLALLGIHSAGFLGALVLAVVIVFAQRGALGRFSGPVAEPPPPSYAYTSGDTQEWRGAAAPALPPPSSVTLVAHYADAQTAQAQFAALPPELPGRATLCWFGQSLLLTLPENEKTETDPWMDRLRQQARNVTLLRKSPLPHVYWVHVDFACVLPSEEKAEQLREELEDYFRAPNNELLLAPWSAAWQAFPREDQQRFQKARRTLGRLEHLTQEAAENPEVRAHMGGLRDKLGLVSRDAAREKMVAFQQARDAEEKRLLVAIVSEGEETVDHAVVELWQRRKELLRRGWAGDPGERDVKQKLEAWQRRSKGILREMAECMGPLPLTGDKPQPGTNAETAQYGYVTRTGTSLSIHAMLFRQLDRGLPAFAEWLGQQGCSQIRYGINILEPEEEPDQE
ncbi:MAG TPA: site-2 protease family protein [Gemmataceae bacterium]